MLKRVAILLALMLSLTPAFAAPAKKTKEQQKLQKEIEAINRQIAANDSKSADMLTKLNLTRRKLDISRDLVKEANASLMEINSRIEEKSVEVEDAQEQLDTMLHYYRKLIVGAYLTRDPKIWYMYLLTGSNVRQMLNRYSYMKDLSSTLSEESVRISQKKAMLLGEKEELEKMREEAGALLKSRNEEMETLRLAEFREKEIVSSLKQQQAANKKKLEQKKKKAAELDRKIQAMIAAEAAKQTSKKKLSAAEQQLSDGFAATKGNLPWPVAGTVTGRFGQQYHPVYKNVKLPNNNGVNISVEAGAFVKAVHEGVVKQVVVMPGYGQCVLVQHGEYYTFYCKLTEVAVKSGSKLKAGQTLGRVDTIGGENQLHFELWKGRTPQNPENWLKQSTY